MRSGRPKSKTDNIETLSIAEKLEDRKMLLVQIVLLAVCLVSPSLASPLLVDEEQVERSQPFVLTVQSGEKTFEITVEPSDKVSDLKRMISLRDSSIAVDRQLLTVVTDNGKEQLTNDEETLSKRNLRSGSKITVTQLGSSSETPNKRLFFGVDPEDQEAVQKKLRELGDEKFKEMFGDDVNPDHIVFSFEHDSENDDHHIKRVAHGIREAFKWLCDVVSGKDDQGKDDQGKNN